MFHFSNKSTSIVIAPNFGAEKSCVTNFNSRECSKRNKGIDLYKHLLSLSNVAITSFSIYTYKLPPKLTLLRKDKSRCNNMYAPEFIIPDLLSSQKGPWRRVFNVTDNPEEATAFLLPVDFSCRLQSCFYDTTGEGRLSVDGPNNSNCDHVRSKYFADVVNYIQTTLPYWNLSYGKNHFFVLTMDRGRCELLEPAVSLLQNATGLMLKSDSKAEVPCFLLQDIVIPPYTTLVAHDGNSRSYLKESMSVDMSLWSNLKMGSSVYDEWDPPARNMLAFFRGSRSHTLRSDIISRFKNSTNITVAEGWDSTQDEYNQNFQAYEFALAPRGGENWSPRYIDALTGAIPVFLSDNIRLPFEHWLKPSLYSVRIPEQSVYDGTLEEQLRSITAQERHILRSNGPFALRSLTYQFDAMLFSALELRNQFTLAIN